MQIHTDISQMSTEQLKAIGFDENRKREIAQNNLNIIYAELALREQKIIGEHNKNINENLPGNGKKHPQDLEEPLMMEEKRDNA